MPNGQTCMRYNVCFLATSAVLVVEKNVLEHTTCGGKSLCLCTKDCEMAAPACLHVSVVRIRRECDVRCCDSEYSRMHVSRSKHITGEQMKALQTRNTCATLTHDTRKSNCHVNMVENMKKSWSRLKHALQLT